MPDEVTTIALGGWLTGQWITGDLDQDKTHPGYLVPTVAGGLVGAYAAAEVGLHRLAEASFGIGVVCWLLLGSIVLNRLLFRRWLPDPLVPTLAIEVAPPALAGLAYFALDGRVASFPACALGGYAVVMALVQLRLVPRYTRLKFSPGFWAFTFSYAAAVTDAIQWVAIQHPPGARILIAAITVRTIRAARRGELLPPAQPPASGQAAPAEPGGAARPRVIAGLGG
jgi:tellurite resistance protein